MKLQNFIEKHLYHRSLISYLLYPISLKYGFFQWLRRKVYEHFPSLSYQSKIKIISVGNIVSGGSGKTPFTIFLAKHLSEKGYNIAVSHRGYKGKFENRNKLISDENVVLDFAKEAGDEAFLLAQKLEHIPVIVGKNRQLSIKILEKKYPGLDYLVLDDSFQHLKVKHDLDFVVFNETGGIGNGFVLPAGILRESLSALKYADQIVVLGENDIPEEIQKYDKPVLKGFYRIKRFYDPDGKDVPLRILQNSRITLLSGIGQPKSFENTIRKSGLSFEKHFRFSDHFDYNNEQILNDLKMEMENFDHLLTTEKDFAKLKFKDISGMKIIVVEVGFELTEGSLEFASAF